MVSDFMYADPAASGPIARCIARANDSTVRVWMKLVTGVYPVASYLARIGLRTSALCPYCRLERETVGHFACRCSKFQDARTAAHDAAWKQVSDCIQQLVGSGSAWTFRWGRTVASSVAEVLLPLRQDGGTTSAEVAKLVAVSGLKPDGIAVNSTDKRVVILEFCRPADSDLKQLAVAFANKEAKYTPIVDALQDFLPRLVPGEWKISLTPLVVGIRGRVLAQSVQQAVGALGLPGPATQVLADSMALASVEAFMLLHRVRYSPQATAGDQSSTLDSSLWAPTRARKRPRESFINQDLLVAEKFRKWTRMQQASPQDIRKNPP